MSGVHSVNHSDDHHGETLHSVWQATQPQACDLTHWNVQFFTHMQLIGAQ